MLIWVNVDRALTGREKRSRLGWVTRQWRITLQPFFRSVFQVDYFQDGSAAAGEKKDAKVEMKDTPSRRKESRESRDSKDSKAEKKEKESEDSKESKEKKEDKKSKEKWKMKITYIIIAFT